MWLTYLKSVKTLSTSTIIKGSQHIIHKNVYIVCIYYSRIKLISHVSINVLKIFHMKNITTEYNIAQILFMSKCLYFSYKYIFMLHITHWSLYKCCVTRYFYLKVRTFIYIFIHTMICKVL